MMDKSYLLGVGFDCDDGHLRITRGKNFKLYGGSQKTHDLMQEKIIKFNEKLDRRGKTLGEISHGEFMEISHSLGLPLRRPKSPASLLKKQRRTNNGG